MKRIFCLTLMATMMTNSGFGRTFVYVSESNDHKIAVFRLHEKTGDLTRVSDLDLDGTPGCLWISNDQQRLYAAVRSRSEFAALSVDPQTGGLMLLSRAPAAGSAAYVYPDKTNKWLLAAYYREGQVSVSRIVNGQIQGEPVQIVETGPKAHCIQTDPANKFAFTPHTGELNKVQQFVFDATTGKLTFNSPPQMRGAEGAGPRHLQFHPNGKWVYLVNEQSKSVTHCDYNAAAGTLSKRATLSTHPAGWDQTIGSCADLEITADGRFLYASNRGHDSIAVFQIDPDSGELTSLGQTPTEKTPRSFNLIAERETFLVAAGQGSQRLIVYRRDAQSGALTPLQTYECGKSPAWVLSVHFP